MLINADPVKIQIDPYKLLPKLPKTYSNLKRSHIQSLFKNKIWATFTCISPFNTHVLMLLINKPNGKGS